MNAQGAACGGGNQPAGGNQAGGNLRNTRANQTNGPILPADPNGQNGRYSARTNQPLLGNTARELDRQAQLGLSSLSRFVFTPNDQQVVLDFLRHHHPNVYNNIMQGQNQPQWWKQNNIRQFRDLLRNAA